jgi:hypothetical protein
MNQDHFTDDDKASMTNFLNFVFEKAKWEIGSKEVFEFAKLYTGAAALVKKIDAHIFEIKKVVDNNKAEKPAASTPPARAK